MEAELEHEVGPVSFNSPHGDSQLRCDLFIGFSLGQEADDFKLSGSCSRVRPVPSLRLIFLLRNPSSTISDIFGARKRLPPTTALTPFRRESEGRISKCTRERRHPTHAAPSGLTHAS